MNFVALINMGGGGGSNLVILNTSNRIIGNPEALAVFDDAMLHCMRGLKSLAGIQGPS